MKPRPRPHEPAKPESSIASETAHRGHAENSDWQDSNWGEGAASAYTALQQREHGRRAVRPHDEERPNSH